MIERIARGRSARSSTGPGATAGARRPPTVAENPVIAGYSRGSPEAILDLLKRRRRSNAARGRHRPVPPPRRRFGGACKAHGERQHSP